MGNTLYFTHGNYSFVSGDVNNPQPYLYSLAINSKTPVERTIPASFYQRYDLPGSPNIAHDIEDTQTVLWYDNDSLYSAFLPADTVYGEPLELSMFSTTANEWTSSGVGTTLNLSSTYHHDLNGSEVQLLDEWGWSSEASVSVPEAGLSFSFGGSPSSDVLPGLITFNASSPYYTWWNNTSPGISDVPVPLVAESEMVYIPYGKEGVLLMMGGYSVSLPCPSKNLSDW